MHRLRFHAATLAAVFTTVAWSCSGGEAAASSKERVMSRKSRIVAGGARELRLPHAVQWLHGLLPATRSAAGLLESSGLIGFYDLADGGRRSWMMTAGKERDEIRVWWFLSLLCLKFHKNSFLGRMV